MAPNVGSSPRRIHRRISGYVPVDGTQVTEPQASKMWNYFFPGPLDRSRCVYFTNILYHRDNISPKPLINNIDAIAQE